MSEITNKLFLTLLRHTMKNLSKALALLIAFSLFSCTKVIYTQKQVLDRYKTKQDVVKAFGEPTEKKTGEGNEEWLYEYKSGGHHPVEYPNAKAAEVTQFTGYKKYVIFTFDPQGNVLTSKCEGIDLTQRKNAPVKTAALVVGIVGSIFAVLALLAHAIKFHTTGVY
jgi:hypothetical protein